MGFTDRLRCERPDNAGLFRQLSAAFYRDTQEGAQVVAVPAPDSFTVRIETINGSSRSEKYYIHQEIVEVDILKRASLNGTDYYIGMEEIKGPASQIRDPIYRFRLFDTTGKKQLLEMETNSCSGKYVIKGKGREGVSPEEKALLGILKGAVQAAIGLDLPIVIEHGSWAADEVIK